VSYHTGIGNAALQVDGKLGFMLPSTYEGFDFHMWRPGQWYSSHSTSNPGRSTGAGDGEYGLIVEDGQFAARWRVCCLIQTIGSVNARVLGEPRVFLESTIINTRSY